MNSVVKSLLLQHSRLLISFVKKIFEQQQTVGRCWSAVSYIVVNLTLIDLPSLTKVAVGGQPESIVQDIENMVRSYVEKVFPFLSQAIDTVFSKEVHTNSS